MRFLGIIFISLLVFVSCDEEGKGTTPLPPEKNLNRLYVRDKCTKDIHCFVVNDVCGCYASLSTVNSDEDLEELSLHREWNRIAQANTFQGDVNAFASTDPTPCKGLKDSDKFKTVETFSKYRPNKETRCTDYYESVCSKSRCVLKVK